MAGRPTLIQVHAWTGPSFVGFAYLLGSVCFGLVAARRHGVDLRAVGSGNVGATNVGRVLGKGTGRVVLLLDALKGFAPALGAHALFGRGDFWTAATGFAAAFGHCYPIWFRFRGGKAAATAAGVLLGAVPIVGAFVAVTYVLAKKLTNRASVGSLAGSVVGVGASGWLDGWRTWPFALVTALAVLLIWRHRMNIVRLVQRQEPKS